MKSSNDKTVRWVWIGGMSALVLGLLLAYAGRWTCDDAYITFRYARNFVEGHGLVFNPGERVEGYTNFLWTVWAALGLWLGWQAAVWADVGSLLSYAGSIFLLIVFHFQLKRTLACRIPLPLAAVGAALHPDWRNYASCGLETSLLTFLLVAAFVGLLGRPLSKRGLLLSGALFGAAFLTRQDALIPAFVGGLFVLWRSRRRFRAGLLYSLPFFALALPFLAWRVSYYGDLMPNTYYAKSAYLTWYSQGWIYLSLYFQRYWALLASIPLLFWGVWRAIRSGQRPEWLAQAGLAAALASAYMFYVARVGGDFMFARMLIPITPFLLILLEIGLQRASLDWPPVATATATSGLLLALTLTPAPVTDTQWVAGVADEHAYYAPDRVAYFQHQARTLTHFLKGLPVRTAYLGAEARVAYLARLPEVIDCYGLTDAHIARLELSQRGRVGHEKLPSPEYLIGERKAHLMLNEAAVEALRLEDYIPVRKIRMGDLEAVMLHWDVDLMEKLRDRGASLPDFPTELDQYLSEADGRSRSELERDFRLFRNFYFDHVEDQKRLDAFEDLLLRKKN